MTISGILLLLALICFFLVTIDVKSRVNFLGLGLFLWVLSLFVGNR